MINDTNYHDFLISVSQSGKIKINQYAQIKMQLTVANTVNLQNKLTMLQDANASEV